MRRVAVAGIGLTKVGEPWEKSVRELFAEAAVAAMKDAGCQAVDALYVANMSGGHLQHQLQFGAMMAEAIGRPGIPAMRVEAGQASGGVAFDEGVKAVASGLCDSVLVGGVEKMSDMLPECVASSQAMAEDQEYVAFTGVTKTGLSAILHRMYTEGFGARPEDVAMFAVRGHDNAVGCAHAQYPFKLSIERVMASPMEADPLHMMECSAVCDGAAAILLCPAERLRDGVEVAGTAVATDAFSIAQRGDPLTLRAVRRAAERAYAVAKVAPKDVDVLEVMDDTTIDGVLSLEGLGFAKRGEGAAFVAAGGTSKEGEIPTNTFGGLKARGNPLGATGIYQVAEVVLQLRGAAGPNQVKDARIGIAQSMGGVGSTCSVSILRRG
jgi:acetyl-CoA C-acetyltransferase